MTKFGKVCKGMAASIMNATLPRRHSCYGGHSGGPNLRQADVSRNGNDLPVGAGRSSMTKNAGCESSRRLISIRNDFA